ncbi:MAG TPA: DUF805 domain-containing protein [Allosphingosinicella sp.]
MEWATLPLKRFAEFTGRSRRKEYWMFVLLAVAVALVLYLVEGLLGLRGWIGPYGPLVLLFELAILIPSIAVGIRRLHDTNRSGWWLMIGYGPALVSMLLPLVGIGHLGLIMILTLVSLVGFVALLVLMVLEGTKGPNQYGPDPKGAEGTATPA